MNISLSIDIEEASMIVKDFIKTYVRNSGCKGVVIGLSGGIDSAVTAILCKQVLGKDRTKCVFLPDDATPKLDVIHKDLLVKKFDLFCKIKNINEIVNKFKTNFVVKPDKLALANMKSRIRMILLFGYANMTDSLVCGASNKSELIIGYFTKYGDGGVDINPIGDLYKTQIWEMAKFLKIPEEIILKHPSAGLIKGQTDENELKIGYKELDKILVGLEKKTPLKKLSKILDIEVPEIQRIKDMRIKTQHKRRLSLIPKIGLRTSGLDWRSSNQLG